MRHCLLVLAATVGLVSACAEPATSSRDRFAVGDLTAALPAPAPCVPLAPTFDVLAASELLPISAPEAASVEVSVVHADIVPTAAEIDWLDAGEVALAGLVGDTVTLLARVHDPACAGQDFRHAFSVAETYPPAAGEPASTAIADTDPRIVRWANAVVGYDPGEAVIDPWRDADAGAGEADGRVVSLGRGGSITLEFDPLIADAPGPDIVVFENGFDDVFLELAFVDVSSDGESWARFPSAYLGPGPVGDYGTNDTRWVGGLAGKYRRGFGTPFDLTALDDHPAAVDGRLDLQAVRYVRVVDVVGDGTTLDTFGRAIYDAWPTRESAGFDLDTIGVPTLP